MLKLFAFALLCLFSLCGTLPLQAYKSAHVIAVGFDTDKKGQETKRYVLFGLLKNGTLSTFGGFRDHGEKDPKDTAARETEEEALGVLGTQNKIRTLLKGVHPFFNVADNICYILPKQKYGKDIAAKFKKVRFNKNLKLTYCQREMVDLVAVDIDKIKEKVLQNKPLLFKDNKGKLRPIRYKSPLIKAVLSGCLENSSVTNNDTKDE